MEHLSTLTFLLETFMHCEFRGESERSPEVTNGETQWDFSPLSQYWTMVFEQYGVPLGQSAISLLYSIYGNLNFTNMSIFLIKYITTGYYVYNLVKAKFDASRERIKEKQTEVEDIQLQIEIVNTKLCVRDAEFTERAALLRRGIERLLPMQARVRQLVAADEALRRAQRGAAAPWGDEGPPITHHSPEEDREFITSLLKEMKIDQFAIPEGQTDLMECGENFQPDPNSNENSIHSSISDCNAKECRVKIVKVTNVYKVAYLKHFIKQKKMRRAAKQALLKKKIDSIKKVLEDWQTSLTLVINTKLAMLDSSTLGEASQEAMGDYSKPSLRDFSDSDSDLKANGTGAEPYFDEYSLRWAQNPYNSYPYSCDDVQDSAVTKEFYDSQDLKDIRCQSHGTQLCEWNGPKSPNVLFVWPEETSSQIAIEDIKPEFESDSRGVEACETY